MTIFLEQSDYIFSAILQYFNLIRRQPKESYYLAKKNDDHCTLLHNDHRSFICSFSQFYSVFEIHLVYIRYDQ